MPKITEMYAFITEESPGEQGIPAFMAPDGTMFPMVGADISRIESLKPIAKEMMKHSNIPMKIVKFTDMEVLEVL